MNILHKYFQRGLVHNVQGSDLKQDARDIAISLRGEVKEMCNGGQDNNTQAYPRLFYIMSCHSFLNSLVICILLIHALWFVMVDMSWRSADRPLCLIRSHQMHFFKTHKSTNTQQRTSRRISMILMKKPSALLSVYLKSYLLHSLLNSRHNFSNDIWHFDVIIRGKSSVICWALRDHRRWGKWEWLWNTWER